MRSRPRALVPVLLLAIACSGGEPNPPAVAPLPTPPPTPTPTPVSATYELEEWGLIGVHHRNGDAITASSGGRGENQGLGSLRHLGGGSGPGNAHALPGRPVIYAHVAEGEARFRIALRLASGGFVERFPAVPLSADRRTLDFGEVRATHDSCRGNGFPTLQSPECATSDGYCEAVDLARYEIGTSACLHVAGGSFNHLFYRAAIDRAALPLRVTFTQENVLRVENPGTDAIGGKLVLVLGRTEDGSGTRVALLDPPPPGGAIDANRAATEPAQVGYDELRRQMLATGLSPAEYDAFDLSWRADIFGSSAPPAMVPPAGTIPYELQPPRDALLYVMPKAAVDRAVAIVAEPPPSSVARAIVVRVILDARLANP